MPFPEAKRIIYNKNPLDKVICQLRFPPILKIETEIPAEFQERIRNKFPNYSETAELNVELTPGIKGAIPSNILRQMFQPSEIKNHEFTSEDGNCKINLTRTFIALSVNKYKRWEEFKEILSIPFDALNEVYNPSYFTRIGLRYIDVIKRSALNLENLGWHELLKSYVLGFLSSFDVNENIKNFENRYEISLSDNQSILRIVTKFVESPDNGEICYMIDSDFFNSQKTEIDQAFDQLDYFRIRGSRLIQWCITNRLHEAMEPQEI